MAGGTGLSYGIFLLRFLHGHRGPLSSCRSRMIAPWTPPFYVRVPSSTVREAKALVILPGHAVQVRPNPARPRPALLPLAMAESTPPLQPCRRAEEEWRRPPTVRYGWGRVDCGTAGAGGGGPRVDSATTQARRRVGWAAARMAVFASSSTVCPLMDWSVWQGCCSERW